MMTMPAKGSSEGFTLVEIALVCVIIGVLIIGILKGQELIANARVLSTTTQIKTIDAAVTTFAEQYNDIPGDIASPDARLPSCTAAPCNVGGDGNGRLNNPPAGNPVPTESNAFFAHLLAAGLITGINPELGDVWNGAYPATPLGGGIAAGDSLDGAAVDFGSELVDATEMPEGMYLNIYGDRPSSGVEFLSATHVAQIDRKLDDGVPGRGFIRAKSASVAGLPPCATAGATGVYREDDDGGNCGLFVHIQR